ncbi:hypothetical protein [Parasulfitobacter algicola]|uniref:Uncharacterized protein n=1 Tax=Parasulfitobacter algicola TaxID=2614809 RepID=A0ABX2IZL7_9RHOB|nr:hypothetical protein [Sulfitobacter algicola]NSX56128.1 hypothetical protein [Sulfitobacter algicola]
MLDQSGTAKLQENHWVQTLIQAADTEAHPMPWQRGTRRKEMFERIKEQSE